MEKYPIVMQMLRTAFNAEDGLSLDVAVRLYKRAAESSGIIESLRGELKEAFSNPSLSWKALLANQEFEVIDADSEEQARDYAVKILWDPMFDLPPPKKGL
jgi:hypothetical protein